MNFLFIVLAAFFNAVSDTLSHHFYTSIFSKKNPKWWDPNISWNYVKFLPFTKYRPDAWHLSKSAMIFCICAAAVSPGIFHPVIDYALLGIVWILVFNLFYDKILVR